MKEYEEHNIDDGTPVLGTQDFKVHKFWLPTALMIPLGALMGAVRQGYIYQAPTCKDLLRFNENLRLQV